MKPRVKHRAVAFSALVFALTPVLTTAARAADQYTNADCILLLSGLQSLDGHQELTKDRGAINVPYKFENAKLRAAIQSNLAELQRVQAELQKLQQSIFREVAGGKLELQPNTQEFADYSKQFTAAQELPCKATLTRIHINDLALQRNEIPGSVLAALDKILDK